MLLEKNYIVTLSDSTPIDVMFSVEGPAARCDEYDSNYSYDEAGLSEHQINEVEKIVEANIDDWLEDVLAEYEESQEEEISDWDKDEY
jgi:hypothetical protein